MNVNIMAVGLEKTFYVAHSNISMPKKDERTGAAVARPAASVW